MIVHDPPLAMDAQVDCGAVPMDPARNGCAAQRKALSVKDHWDYSFGPFLIIQVIFPHLLKHEAFFHFDAVEVANRHRKQHE